MQNLNRSGYALLLAGRLISVVFASLFLFLSGTVNAACVDGVNDKNGKPCGGSGDDDAKVDIDQLQHQFTDPLTDSKITGDEGGAYVDGVECVSAGGFSAGGTSLRTVTHADPCDLHARGNWRVLKMHLPEENAFDFDQDGVVEALEEVPARLIIASPYASNPSADRVSIWVLQVVENSENPDADTIYPHSVPRMWQIEYEGPAEVSADGNTRIVTMHPAVGARICADTGVKRRKDNPCDWGNPVGSISSLPFTVTISPAP